jgi:hypothetical protein
MKLTTLMQLRTFALPTILGSVYIQIYFPTDSIDVVEVIGANLSYPGNPVCYSSPTIQWAEDKRCQNQTSFSRLAHILFQVNDTRSLVFKTPGYTLSVSA